MINNVVLRGNIVRDPEMRFLKTGMAVCNFQIAYNDKRKNGQEQTFWIDCTCFDKTASLFSERSSKGSTVFVAGKLCTKEWQDKTGSKRKETYVLVNTFDVIKSSKQPASNMQPDNYEIEEDDIPF